MEETLLGLAESNRKEFYFHVGMSEELYNYCVEKCEPEVRDGEFAKFAKYEAVTINVELPQLAGSEKQINWASDIRRNKLANIAENLYRKIRDISTETKDQLMAETKMSSISEVINMAFLMQAANIISETSAKKIIETR
jgi:hypothetical protein